MVKNGEMRDNSLIPRDFLEKILNKQIIDYKISGGSNPGDNFTSILFSVDVIVQGEDKPLHLLFKTFPFHPTRQKMLEDTNLFLKEYLVYNTWFPELMRFQTEMEGATLKTLKPAVPQLVAGKAIDYEKEELNSDEDPMLNNFILMIDERKTNGFRMADKLRGLGFNHVKLVLNEVAKLHALGHAYKVRKNLENVRSKFSFIIDPFFCNPMQKPTMDSMIKLNVALIQDTLQDFLATRPDLVNTLERFAEEGKVFDLLSTFLNPDGVDEEEAEKLMRVHPETHTLKPPIKDQWIVPGHGDCWTNNMIFKYDEAGKVTEAILVDLQLARESCIMADIVYFLYTSTDTDFRKKHLQDVLRWYFEKFTEYCEYLKVDTFPGFTWENFERKFNRSKIFGFLFALLVQPIILCKPEKAVDLDTVEINGNDVAKGEELTSLFKQSSGQDSEMNDLLRERFTSMLLELHEEGVL